MWRFLENVRVFESSDDIAVPTRPKLYTKAASNPSKQRPKHIITAATVDEDKQPNLPPCCVLQSASDASARVARKKDAGSREQTLVSVEHHERRLLELVFGSLGEIRAGKDGLDDAKLLHGEPQVQWNCGSRCSYGQGHCRGETGLKNDEMDVDHETIRRQVESATCVEQRRTTLFETSARPSRQESDGHCNPRVESSLSADGDESSNEDLGSHVSRRSEESDEQEKDPFGAREEQKADEPVWVSNDVVAKVARDGVTRIPTRSLTMDHLERKQGDGTLSQATDSFHSVRHTTGFCKKEAPSCEDTSHEARQRPASLKQVEQALPLDRAREGSPCQSKRSPTMEVDHFVSDKPVSSPKNIISTGTENSMGGINRMEKELQKEKRRVLEKTSRLFSEQDKNQQLRDRVGILEARLAAQDADTNSNTRRAARDHDKQRQQLEKEQTDRADELEVAVHLQKADIARLEHDKIQLRTALEQLKKTESKLSSRQHCDTIEVAGLRAELDDMNRRFYEFLAKVERWKRYSKEKMQHHDDRKTDLPDFLEKLWLDFPRFSGVVPRPHSERPSRSCEPQQQSTFNVDESADVVFILKKKLREREDKLQQTQMKYMELKEMCARQCVREADLQNFINEHRLRGNLIIRRDSRSKSKEADSNQVPKDQDDQSRRNARQKMTLSRDNNIPASYNERGRVTKDVVNEEYSDNHDDADDCEDGDAYGNSLRTSNVFVHVGRDRVCKHASTTNSAKPQKCTTDPSRGKRRMQPKQQQQEELVERIRCRSSRRLAPQYERVAQEKKSSQQPWIQPRACPPRCGSRLSFMRRKAPRTGAQATRPVTTGVMRPWI